MSQYRKILLIADTAMKLSPAFDRAVSLARGTGAELNVVLYAWQASIAALGAVDQKAGELAKWGLMAERERWLRDHVQRFRDTGLNIQGEVAWGRPQVDEVVQKVLTTAPDLVIKDVQLHPLLERVLFTPLDWKLLRLCPAPLLLVHSQSSGMPRRVAVAVDTAHPLRTSSGLNDRILAQALGLAIQCDARIDLVHVFEEMVPMAPGDVISPAILLDAFAELRRIQRESFQAFAQAHSIPAERRHFLVGPRCATLSSFSRESKTDVLVLGTTYRTGLDRILLGSTAEDVLTDVACDVLAVKPEGFWLDVVRMFDLPHEAGRGAAHPASAAPEQHS